MNKLQAFENAPVVSVACRTRVLHGKALGTRIAKNGNVILIVREADGKIRSAVVGKVS